MKYQLTEIPVRKKVFHDYLNSCLHINLHDRNFCRSLSFNTITNDFVERISNFLKLASLGTQTSTPKSFKYVLNSKEFFGK